MPIYVITTLFKLLDLAIDVGNEISKLENINLTFIYSKVNDYQHQPENKVDIAD